MTGKQHYKLGLSYCAVDVKQRNINSAIIHFENAINTGFADAYYFLGRIYSIGDGVEKDLNKSISYYKKGIELNSHKCSLGLGLLYYMGVGIEKDEEIAFELFKQHYNEVLMEANNDNDAISQYLIGISFYYGIYVTRYVLEAIKWFTKSASNNFSDAQYMLGMIYETLDETDSTKYLDNAISFYKLASKQGHMYATYALALISLENKDYEQTKDYLLIAANERYMLANFTLGLFYEEREPNNKLKAFDQFLIAAKQGHEESMYKVGLYYHKALGINQDLNEAIKWYLKAADKKNTNAIYQLGMIELMSNNKDMGKVIKYLEEAALLNHPQAQYNLAVVYQKGDGVEINFNKALYYLNQSANAGFANAQYNLGLMHFRGDGTPKDDKLAFDWWQKAADQGFKPAQELLVSVKNSKLLNRS